MHEFTAQRDVAQGRRLELATVAVDSGHIETPEILALRTHPDVMKGVVGEAVAGVAARAAACIRGVAGVCQGLLSFETSAVHDGRGRPLNGAHRYRLRFAPGALPPVDAFWSLTMYDARDYMLVDNPIDRYAIGDRTAGLRPDADGGLTLYLQHAPPTDAAAHANWLPAPAGDFYVCLRAYVPHEELLDGRYALPALDRLDEAGVPQ